MAVTVTTLVATPGVPAAAVNVVVVAPPGTATEEGTVNTLALSVTVTVEPALGAGPDSVAVQMELEPATTVAGAQLSEDRVAPIRRVMLAVAELVS
ncbi:MAG TPA: hypothetical protein VLY04_23935 [Bryobacteraceae bacterium]|nr:hypothetical protein [Bryobacteraceae bacterium]